MLNSFQNHLILTVCEGPTGLADAITIEPQLIP